MLRKQPFTPVPCSIQMIPYLFYNLLSYFVIFPELFPKLFFFFKLKTSSSLLYLAISLYLDVPFPLLPVFNVTQSNCCNLCFVRSLFPFSCTLLSVTVVLFFTFYITIAWVRAWKNMILFFLVFFPMFVGKFNGR